MTQTSTAFAANSRRSQDRAEIASKLAQRYLVLYGFADKKIARQAGGSSVWNALRRNRLPCRRRRSGRGFAPPASSLTFTLAVTGTALQWAGRVVFTDVAVVATSWDLLDEVHSEALSMQIAETKERKRLPAPLLGQNPGQLRHPAAAPARTSLLSDTLDPNTVTRTQTDMEAPWRAPMERADLARRSSARSTTPRASRKRRSAASSTSSPSPIRRVLPGPPLKSDRGPDLAVLRPQPDVHRNEMGYWSGITFCESNC